MLPLLAGKEAGMTDSDQLTDEKYPLLKTLLYAIFAGSMVGVFDLWAFEPSLKLFLAGQASGITFSLVFVFISYFNKSKKGIWLITLTTISGALAGLVWWFVADSFLQLWIVILIGVCLTNLTMWIDTGFKSETN
jgi:hypothetical protein